MNLIYVLTDQVIGFLGGVFNSHLGREVESNAVEVHVHHLRRKLGAALIQTVRGLGYTILRDEPAC